MNTTSVTCSCGGVRCEARGTPIVAVVCYCDDCQKGARQIEALPNAAPVLTADGGADFVVWRKDRFSCSKGSELLRAFRLKEDSPTKRVVASCCNSAMYLDFEKGHWIDVYRTRCAGPVPDPQMRLQTQFAPGALPNDVPNYRAYPLRFLAGLLLARLQMALG